MSIFEKIGQMLTPEKRLSDVGDESPDKKFIDFLYKTLDPEATKYDKEYKKTREDNRKFYKGDQWRRSQPSDKSKSITNFLSLIVRDEVAILTDAMPEISVRPVDYMGDTEKAGMLRKLIYHVSYVNDFQQKLYKAVHKSDVEGISYFRTNWNPTLQGGLGDIEILVESADCIKRDPSGEDNYFKIEKSVTLAEINRLYPDKFKEVSADNKDVKEVANKDNKLPPKPVTSTDGSETVVYETQPVTIQEQLNKVSLDMWWIRDDSVEELDPTDDKEVKDEPKALYPYGRWVIVANKKVKLKDYACKTLNPTIIPLILDIDPETDLYGISPIDFCKQQQIDYNEMRALQKDWTRASVFLSYTYDPKSRLDPKKIKNRSWGRAIPSNPGEFRWDAPPTLPNESWRDLTESKTNIEYVSGITDITQGRRPASVQSAEAIRLLQESSKTILRPKARAIEGAIKKLGQSLIDWIQIGYTSERMMRILGYDNSAGSDLAINSPEVLNGVESIKNDLSIGQYDVYVEPDSTLPKSEGERYARIKEAANDGFADRLAVLSNSGIPNWQEIEQRLKAKEEEAKQTEKLGAENEQLKAQLDSLNKELEKAKGQGKPPSVSISYKDVPPQGQVQLLQQVGVTVNPNETEDIHPGVVPNPNNQLKAEVSQLPKQVNVPRQ